MSFGAIVHNLESLTWSELWGWLVGTPLVVISTIVGAIVLKWLVNRGIERVVRTGSARAAERDSKAPRRAVRVIAHATGLASERQRQRMATMGAILRSVSTIVIFTVALLTVMQEIGMPLAPLLTSAGVTGVTLGFGAQSLVKDFLSGIFMIVEDQYGVGDVIDTGEAIGTVEDVTLRVTRLRDGNGVVWYIRNGEIVRIGNRSQGWSTAIVDTAVAYDEDIDRAITVMREVVHQMDQDPTWQGRLLEEPTVVGVESIAAGAVTVRIIAKCAPNENFPVQREIRERLKVALDRSGVRAPQLAPYGAAAAPRA